MADHKLVNMKQPVRSKEAETLAAPEQPVYPWGLQVHLENDQLEQLGMATLPKVGSQMMLGAKVEVISVRESEEVSPGGVKKTRRNVELQITDMGFAAVETDKKDADVLYSS